MPFSAVTEHQFFLYFFILLLHLSSSSSIVMSNSHSLAQSSPPILNVDDDHGPVTTTSPLLDFLQLLQQIAFTTFPSINFDPKTYIDLSLKSSLPTTQQAFNALPRDQNGRIPAPELHTFIKTYLNGAGDDLVPFEPVDFVSEPEEFLPGVKNSVVRAWGLKVHSLWKNLSRRVSPAVDEHPELHTLLPLPKSCMIPGSRFREVYYWDSYWVIRGLLASKMYTTAKSIVTNLVYLVEEYGFVLNGARVYYTNRSQPPLLSSMIYEIYKRTGDLAFVQNSLPALLKEYSFWNSGMHKVIVQDSSGCNHTLSRYYAKWDKPRPESAVIDKDYASKFSDIAAKARFYREVASAAESGWDFSTRWMRDSSDLTTLATTSIVPVDLNAFILKMELDISFLAEAIGDSCTSKKFLEASSARKKAFDSVFWNEGKGQWLDCWLSESSTVEDDVPCWKTWKQNENVFASNFVPLWIEHLLSDNQIKTVARSLNSSGLLQVAGIATSLSNSGQQWDYPNGWAPLQHMIIEGLAKSGSEEARLMAKDLAAKWIRTNYAAYIETGEMHEKYNVEKCGDFGGGGLYVPQTGFGWTNGVALALLEEFGWPDDQRLDCE